MTSCLSKQKKAEQRKFLSDIPTSISMILDDSRQGELSDDEINVDCLRHIFVFHVPNDDFAEHSSSVFHCCFYWAEKDDDEGEERRQLVAADVTRM